MSANGRRPAALEHRTEEDPGSVARALGATGPKVRVLDPAGPPISGGHPYDAMLILPCGMKTVAGIRTGYLARPSPPPPRTR